MDSEFPNFFKSLLCLAVDVEKTNRFGRNKWWLNDDRILNWPFKTDKRINISNKNISNIGLGGYI